jgi:hypothetical protein
VLIFEEVLIGIQCAAEEEKSREDEDRDRASPTQGKVWRKVRFLLSNGELETYLRVSVETNVGRKSRGRR